MSREASVEDSHQNDILFNVFSKTGKSGDVVKGLIKSLNERPASNNNESLLLKKHLLFSSATLITNTFIESAIPVNHKERYLEIILLQTLSIILLDYYSSKHSKFQRIFFSNIFIFYFLENISLMHRSVDPPVMHSLVRLRTINTSFIAGHITFLTPAHHDQEEGMGREDTRWVAFNPGTCFLSVFSDMSESEVVREIDLTPATFLYDLENKHQSGHIQIW